MVNKTIAIYSIIDDILKATKHYDDKRRTMTDAEVITTAIVSSLFFSGNMEKARAFMKSTGIVKDMLSKSRFCRRIHALSDMINDIFHQLGMVLKEINVSTEYIIDSFPIPICDNIRIPRCRIIKSEDFRGYIKSKRRYFYGIKVHILTTSSGIPVEYAFLPGSFHDIRGLNAICLNLPRGSEIYADSAYIDYDIEDILKEIDNISLQPIRKKNSERYDEPVVRHYKKLTRKLIETIFSSISYLFPKWIHAVTLDGFLLKVRLFILAFTLDKVFL